MDGIAGPMPGEEITSPPWGELGRVCTLGVVSMFSKALLNIANTTEVTNTETLDKYIQNRDKGVGLLTVCNHTSTFDDPGVVCAMLPWSFFLTENAHKGVRWTLCAKEICFSNSLLSQFFRNGKVLPVDRKGGVEQPIMDVTSGRLSQGDWVHIFPEGRVSFSGQMVPFKRGIGKLVCDYVQETGSPPVVLPFYHSGMGEVKTRHSYGFNVGKHVTVNVGEPVDIPREMCAKCYANGVDQRLLWKDITKVVESSMKDLEERSAANVDQSNSRDKAGAGNSSNQKDNHRSDDTRQASPA